MIETQVADFAAGGAMQQGEDAQQRLVRVDGRVGGPASEQLALLMEGQRPLGMITNCPTGEQVSG